MKTIIVPYIVDQNEPSRPLNQVFDLPYHDELRRTFLKNLFIEHLCTDCNHDDITVTNGKEDDYGDIVVEGPGGLFLFVTFITE